MTKLVEIDKHRNAPEIRQLLDAKNLDFQPAYVLTLSPCRKSVTAPTKTSKKAERQRHRAILAWLEVVNITRIAQISLNRYAFADFSDAYMMLLKFGDSGRR